MKPYLLMLIAILINDGDNATLRDENGEIVDFYNYP